MVRTAILAGILLVLLAIAADRPGTLPYLPRIALVAPEGTPTRASEPLVPAAEKAIQKIVEDIRPAPTPERLPSAHEEEVAADEPAAVEEPAPAVAPEPVVAAAPAPIQAAPSAPEPAPHVAAASVAPALPVTQPGAPLRLLPLVMEPAAAVAPPAPMAEVPVVAVPTRPLYKPVDELPRGADVAQMPELPAPPVEAPIQNIAQAQPGEAPVKFMTREERSRELYKLAREMEDTFMSKFTR